MHKHDGPNDGSNKETTERMTDFGYEQVPWHQKSQRVGHVFDSVASRYDIMNDLMSGGLHRLWKRFAVELARVNSGYRVLDIAGGTGDLSYHLLQRVGSTGHVVLADINASMLREGRDKLLDKGTGPNISYIQANAEQLPFDDASFDAVTLAFGLRNMTDKPKVLAELNRVLRPGGWLCVLEFSHPISPLLKKAYDAYSFKILPKLGELIAKDAASYQYLAESIRKHPPQKELREMFHQAGFADCDYVNLLGGIVAVHRGVRL